MAPSVPQAIHRSPGARQGEFHEPCAALGTRSIRSRESQRDGPIPRESLIQFQTAPATEAPLVWGRHFVATDEWLTEPGATSRLVTLALTCPWASIGTSRRDYDESRRVRIRPGGTSSRSLLLRLRPLSKHLRYQTITKPEKKGASSVQIQRNPTRSVRIGSITIGGGHPIAVQSMTATHTHDVDATRAGQALQAAGADVVRIAVDSRSDAEALAEIRRQTPANLSVDLQENYRLAEEVAPACRQDPLQPGAPLSPRAGQAVAGQGPVSWPTSRPSTTVRIRVGVNCGSVDPAKRDKYDRRRLDRADAGKCPGALRAARSHWVSRATASR